MSSTTRLSFGSPFSLVTCATSSAAASSAEDEDEDEDEDDAEVEVEVEVDSSAAAAALTDDRGVKVAAAVRRRRRSPRGRGRTAAVPLTPRRFTQVSYRRRRPSTCLPVRPAVGDGTESSLLDATTAGGDGDVVLVVVQRVNDEVVMCLFYFRPSDDTNTGRDRRREVMQVGRGRGVHGAWRERNVAVLQVLLPGAGYLQVGMAERCRPFMNFDFACDLIRLIGIFIIIL